MDDRAASPCVAIFPCGFCGAECFGQPRRLTYAEGEYFGVFCGRQCLLDWLALGLDVGAIAGVSK